MTLFQSLRVRTVLLAAMIVVFGAAIEIPAQAPQAAAARPAAIQWLPVKAALDAPLDSQIYVRCRLVSVAPPRPESRAPWSLYVADSSGMIRVVVFQDGWKQIPDTSFIEPGTALDLYGKVSEYRGERQLEIAKPNHFRRTPDTVSVGGSSMRGDRDMAITFTTVSIGAVNITNVGQPIRVRGVVAKYEESTDARLPFRVLVRDNNGAEIEGVFWKSVADRIPPENRPAVGQPIELSGIGAEFSGRMNIRVDEPHFVSRASQVSTRGPKLGDASATVKLVTPSAPIE